MIKNKLNGRKLHLLQNIILLSLCFITIISFSSCRSKDADKWYDFQGNQYDGKYNAIIAEFEEDNTITFFIEEQYGIWEKNGQQQLIQFDLKETPSTAGPIGKGNLEINLITPQTYYCSVAYGSGAGSSGIGESVFRSHTDTITYSDDDIIATITPNEWTDDKISDSPLQKIIFQKVLLPEDKIVSFDDKIAELNFIPDDYFKFLHVQEGDTYVFEAANMWVDAVTKIGEWENGGVTIPVRMEFSDKVPYVKIYDITDSGEKWIFDAFAICESSDSFKIEAVYKNEVFYAKPETAEINKISK